LKKGTRLFFYAFTLLFVLSFTEIASFLTINFLQTKGVFYNPSISDSFEDYLLKRDNVLGWPSPVEFGGSNYDSSGSRIVPSFPDKNGHQTCISLYGDSFTWGDEVEHEYAWGNVLSKLVGCRVANYGVSGYGSDQAYIRFTQNINDDAPIVFLNHLSENILRNANQLRDLLYPEGGLGFKPRFVLNEEGALELLPLPTFDSTQYEDIILHPEQYFTNDYFIPGGLSGITSASFPYTISIINGLNNFHVRAELRDEPWYMEFYETGHPSQALETTLEILKAFQSDAIGQGKTPVITVIPTGLDLLYFLEHQAWPYDNLIDELSLRGISAFNFGTEILKSTKNADPCLLFDNCSAHYNEKGYSILAKIAYELLMKRQLLDKIGPKPDPA
jgi:hypothetical protein